MVSFDTIWYQEVFMPALTLRLPPSLAKSLDKVCKEKGYKKTGLITTLIRDFLKREKNKPIYRGGRAEDLEPLIGMMSIGGDAVEDSELYYE